ncbi:MAG: hypothetical protein H7Z12_18600 [Rhodospirillaceae bacterium]|nr:hypothetical protein [Rhodospirillales bacterium]
MMTKNVDSRLQRAMQEKTALEFKIRRLRTMQSTEARRADAHRKIVVGSAVLAATRDDPELKRAIARVLHAQVKGARDREILGLPPLAQPEVT